jgi:Protein of unknown function (DUF1403)
VRRAGRSEDEASLRDTLHLTRPGADPGPAGRRLLAWRALTAGPAGQRRSAIAVAALRLAGDEALQQAIEAAEACAAGARPPPFAAARTFELGSRALAQADRGDGRGTARRLAGGRRCSPSG